MRQRVVVIGGGVGGTVVANRLASARGARRGATEVVVVDSHGDHIYQPGLVYVPLGMRKSSELRRDLRSLLHPGVRLEVARAEGVDTTSREVRLEGRESLPYDFLVLATGARVDPGRIPGFREAALHFHCPHRASSLSEAMAAFQGGDLVVGATRLPYKCPLAPMEMALLVDDHLRRDGRHRLTRIHFAYPVPRLNASPRVSELVEQLLCERGIEMHVPFEVSSVDPERKELEASSGERLGFDLLILVPPHGVAPVLKNSGLSGDSGFTPTHPRTLKVRDGVYALGDNADLPAPKLGSAAVYQADTVVQNLLAELSGRAPGAHYDGRSKCIVETGRGRAMMVETSYGGAPVPKPPGRRNLAKKRLFSRFYFTLIARR